MSSQCFPESSLCFACMHSPKHSCRPTKHLSGGSLGPHAPDTKNRQGLRASASKQKTRINDSMGIWAFQFPPIISRRSTPVISPRPDQPLRVRPLRCRGPHDVRSFHLWTLSGYDRASARPAHGAEGIYSPFCPPKR